MSAFKDDLAENMKDPEFAYEYGRSERELEIVKLLEGMVQQMDGNYDNPKEVYGAIYDAIALIKGEKE